MKKVFKGYTSSPPRALMWWAGEKQAKSLCLNGEFGVWRYKSNDPTDEPDKYKVTITIETTPIGK